MTLDEMKSKWSKENDGGNYDELTMQKIVKDRVRKHTNTAFKYFWAAFVLQNGVYGMLCYVILKHWADPFITLPALLGIAIFIPFTVMMMKRYKSMGLVEQSSMIDFVQRRRELLENFYRFKKRYELVLIPVATFIGIFLVFELYVPGGVWTYPAGAAIAFFISLASCIIAIQNENKRNFEEPLERFKMILNDLRSEA